MPNPNPPTDRQYSRRRILAWGGSGAIGAIGASLVVLNRSSDKAITPEAKAPAPDRLNVGDGPSLASSPPGELKRERFLPYLNSDFDIAESGAKCKLVEIGENVRMTAPRETFVSFSLIFQAAGDLELESQIHRLSHPQLGSLDLFLTPVGVPGPRVHLEAICSQRA